MLAKAVIPVNLNWLTRGLFFLTRSAKCLWTCRVCSYDFWRRAVVRGGREVIPVNVRIIAASNKNLIDEKKAISVWTCTTAWG